MYQTVAFNLGSMYTSSHPMVHPSISRTIAEHQRCCQRSTIIGSIFQGRWHLHTCHGSERSQHMWTSCPVRRAAEKLDNLDMESESSVMGFDRFFMILQSFGYVLDRVARNPCANNANQSVASSPLSLGTRACRYIDTCICTGRWYQFSLF